MLVVGNGISVKIVLQVLILILLSVGFYLAHSGKTTQHCKFMKAALFLEVFAIVFLMSPIFFILVGNPLGSILAVEVWAHHIVGLIVVLLVIYIILAVRGSVSFLGEPYRLMKPTLLLWILVLLGGAFIYIKLYVSA